MSGTRDLRDLEKMSFLGLQEGLTDEDLLGSRTATDGRGNIPPQPPSFTEWQQVLLSSFNPLFLSSTLRATPSSLPPPKNPFSHDWCVMPVGHTTSTLISSP
jgi:hypothetical protein